jgi:hypothetical protein
MANTAFLQQDPNTPLPGGYVQSAQGITQSIVTEADTSGNAVKSIGASGGVFYAGVGQYRDQAATVQNSATAAAPTAGTAIATLTTPAAGTYEISGTLAISGTTVVAADSHNFNLKKGATTLLTNIPFGLISTTGAVGSVPFGPVLVVLDGSTSVTVNAVGNATASSVYAAQLIGRLVG